MNDEWALIGWRRFYSYIDQKSGTQILISKKVGLEKWDRSEVAEEGEPLTPETFGLSLYNDEEDHDLYIEMSREELKKMHLEIAKELIGGTE